MRAKAMTCKPSGRYIKISFLLAALLVPAFSSCTKDKKIKDPNGRVSTLGQPGGESARIPGKDLGQSLAFYKKSLVILLKLHGEANAEVADTYEKMARVHQEMGNQEGVVEYISKALKSLSMIYRKDHPRVVQTFKDAADIYLEIGDARTAIGFYREFQAMGSTVLGSAHPEVLESHEKIGDAYRELGQLRDALTHYLEWAKLVQKSPTLGRKHPEMARAYNNIGDLYHKLGEVPKAEKAKEMAVAIMYPSAGDTNSLMRSRFHVSIKSSDPKRNRAKVSFPDSATLEFSPVLMNLPTGKTLSLLPVPVISEFDIVNVELAKVQQGKGLLFYLDTAAAGRLSQLTGSSYNGSLVLVIDGNAVGERPISGKIQDGQLFTFVDIPDELLEQMVFSLKETCKKLRGRTRLKLSGG